MSLLFVLVVVWWLAAPDKFTAAARTATGTGLKAAGTGAKVHWNGGRDGRALGRTKRRDRWAKRGGWWRKLLGLEHGAVITGKAVKGAGKLAGAAVKPVPGAIRDGWRAGQARHGARTAGRPVPVALDPPWWHKPASQDSTGQDAPAVEDRTATTGPETADGTGPGQPTEPGIVRTLTGARRQPWMPQDSADTDPIDQNANNVEDDSPPFPPPIDPPAGTAPASTTTPATEGDRPVSVNVPAEIGDLTTLHQFADTVIADADENGPGSAYAQACSSLREYFSRDFGQEVNTATGAFEEAAAALTAAWTQLVEAAQGVKQEALTSIGG